MDGMSPIRFPTSARLEETQRFMEQGIAQLHGFWYLESERSFRQAASLEPDLAIAYWGMAMSNVNNAERARGFIHEAMERLETQSSRRERLYIEALDRFLKSDRPDDDTEDPQKKAEGYIADLEKILHEFPDDIEAKALLGVQLWMSERDGVKMPSRYGVSALLDQVFDEQPLHPAHHYKIHLWDRQRPENALESAAKCGPALPGVAHMWHMPGHIYSRLHRYQDAAWQQEASARVDHAHMAHARLMPDEIHNFAHNNEWLTRNLIHVGRVEDALVQARNLVSMPQHPRYNSLKKRGSFRYGHQRLLQVLTTYEMWDQLVKEAQGPFLSATGNDELDLERAAWLAVAHWMNGNRSEGRTLLRSLQRQRLQLQQERLDAADAADAADDAPDGEPRTRKQRKEDIDRLKRLIARVSAAAATVRNDASAVDRHAKDAKLEKLLHARWMARAGDLEAGVKIARQAVKDGPGEVPPLAALVDLLWEQGDRDEAQQRFAELRDSAAHADLDSPPLNRLSRVADELGLESDWRQPPNAAADLGERPPLDSLGPFQWESYMAPAWQAVDESGGEVTDDRFAGRPRILIFYLGFGCLHCVEQLHAFSPMADAFREAGIELGAISTESAEQLQLGVKSFDKDLEMPLFADPDHKIFKEYRCWDDFEDQPLHGTFLIDASGRVLWQDISHEPFEDAAFLLEEAKRLLLLAS
jgi:peroxiredoxin